MTYLTCIGSQGQNDENRSGFGSRGYYLSRSGRVVTRRWGGVVVDRANRVFWRLGVREDIQHFDSSGNAEEFCRRQMLKLTAPSRAYSELRKGAKILGFAEAHTRKPRSIVERSKRAVSPRPKAKQTSKQVVRAISIRQPYAELILRGIKKEEYRSRRTTIRGRVYIYASLTNADDDEAWEQTRKRPGAFPRGVVVGSVEIVDCVQDDEVGDFAYLLKAPRRLRRPRVVRNQPQPVFWRPKFR